MYGQGKEGEAITVNGVEFNALLRKVQPGRLSTTAFELHEEKATTRRGILKDIHYNPTNYDVIHLDFEEHARRCPDQRQSPDSNASALMNVQGSSWAVFYAK